jgi:hypothetical protein
MGIPQKGFGIGDVGKILLEKTGGSGSTICTGFDDPL